MNARENYIQAVLHNVSASKAECEKIETDLRAHLEEAVRAGEPLKDVLDRMGSPEEVAAAFMEESQMQYAGFWIRMGAFVLDMIVVIAMMGILSILVILGSNFVPQHPETVFSTLIGALAILMILAGVFSMMGILFLYFPILEGRFGQTLGKKVFGLRVLKENGLPIGYREAFIRRISFYFDIFPVDALFVPFTEKCQRGFDIIAHTVVIREK